MHPVAYAREFAATVGPKPITSPFGAWLLPAASGIYGEDVRHLAGQLLTSAPEPVATALAYWGLLPAHVIPAYAATGPIPPQAVADEWTREKTLGMIDRFPGDVTGTVSVIASAIACTLDWTVPLDKVGSDLLGGEFGARLSSAMTTTATHDVRIYRTRTAGLACAVRMADSRGVNVTSVLASPDVSAADTQQAARNIVNGSAEHIRLDRLPSGSHNAFDVKIVTGIKDSVTAILPAWEATSSFDVGAAPGMTDLANALGGNVRVLQSAYAKFGRTGFKAAAATAMLMRGAAMPSTVRAVTARYNRPYAVVASAVDANTAWRGIPIFEAWVTAPTEVTD